MKISHGLALSLLVAVAGCGEPTELMLIVKAAPGLSFGEGGEINALRVSVQPANNDPLVFTYTRTVALCALTEQGQEDCRPQRYAEPDYDKSLTLPVRFLLEPGQLDPSQTVRVWIDAQLGSKTRIANGLRFQFSPGRRLWLEVPLYRDCLGVVACQAEDRVCGSDQACTDARPTTEKPPDVDLEPNDLAGLFNSVDAAQACGTPPMQCCQGQVCNGSASCNANGYCIDPTVTCGQQGQACCAAPQECSAQLACVGGTCVTACGDTGQMCCAGSSNQCNKGTDKCIDGTCQACGVVGQQCCPGPSCFASDAICNAINRCEACGGLGQLCCDNMACLVGTCGFSSSSDMARLFDLSMPLDFSVPIDGGKDGGVSIGLDGGLGGSSIHPQGGGVPAGPPMYCL